MAHTQAKELSIGTVLEETRTLNSLDKVLKSATLYMFKELKEIHV